VKWLALIGWLSLLAMLPMGCMEPRRPVQSQPTYYRGEMYRDWIDDMPIYWSPWEHDVIWV
jgi:hypothetical protein